VSIPPHVLPIVAEHVVKWAGPELLFVGRDGRRINGATVYRAFVRARERVGLSLSFHDYGTRGRRWRQRRGASLADLKRRLGHSTSSAALRYMHPMEGRDREIAAALSDLAKLGDGAPLPRKV
jgi:integrase-like protein